MRIYTEVIFKWDDKQDHLVETSSKSFDYSGELALCGKWHTIDLGYDDYGNYYQGRGFKAFGDWREWKVIKKSEKGSEDSEVITSSPINYGNKSGMVNAMYAEIKTPKSSDHPSRLWQEKSDLSSWFFSEYGKGLEDDATANQNIIDAYDPDAADDIVEDDGEALGQDEDWYQGLSDREKQDYEEDPNNPGFYIKKIWGEPKDEETIAKPELERIMSEWEKLTDPDIGDPFQKEIEDAIEELKIAEKDVSIEFDKLVGAEGEFEEIKKDWETSREELIGEAVYDKEGNLISEGTYTQAMREASETKEEDLKDVVLTREEELDILREEAKGEVRSAEARIGAAGFAATGVGSTAREILAEEIGEEARDIEVGFTEARTDIKEGYLEKIKPLQTGKTSALEGYITARDKAAKDIQAPWEKATREYEKMLKGFGAVKTGPSTKDYKFEDFDYEAAIGTPAQALKTLQGDLNILIQDIRGRRDDEGTLLYGAFDPFAASWSPMYGTTDVGGSWEAGDPLYTGTEWRDVMGFAGTTGVEPLGMTFEDLFDPTLAGLRYEPSEALRLYDPDKPFEVDWGMGDITDPSLKPPGK